VPPFSVGTSFACNMASSGRASSKVRVGVPVGGALDAVPVDLARLLHVGQPGDFGTIDVAILDQRVGTRRAEATAEGGELECTQVLTPEDQHRMLGKRRFDPGEDAGIERLQQVDPEGLGSERSAEGAKLRCLCHPDPPFLYRSTPGPSLKSDGTKVCGSAGSVRSACCRGVSGTPGGGSTRARDQTIWETQYL
jgi:hypothetical protein